MKVSNLKTIALVGTLFISQLWAQNANNTKELAILRWYQANQVTQFAACTQPEGLAFDGEHMWVGCGLAGGFQEFNASDGTLIRTITNNLSPLGLLYDGANIWAAGGNLVWGVNASTGASVGQFTIGPVGSGADYMTFDGQYLWAAVGTATVARILASSGTVTIYTLPCSSTTGMAFDGSHVWVSCDNTSAGTILQLSSTGAILKTVTVGLGPSGMCFDGTNIWVANFSGSSVSRVTVSSSAVSTFTVGTGPTAVAFDGKYIWVPNAASGTVTKLLASSGAVVGTFAAGNFPAFVAFDGGNIWVTNHLGNTVAKY